MQTIARTTAFPGLANIFLTLVAACIVLALHSGFTENLGISARTAFWLLFVVGFIMCALGPLGQGEQVGWANPRHLAGYLLGAAALLLGAAVLFNWSLPLIAGPRAAVLALGLIIALKVVIALFYPRL